MPNAGHFLGQPLTFSSLHGTQLAFLTEAGSLFLPPALQRSQIGSLTSFVHASPAHSCHWIPGQQRHSPSPGARFLGVSEIKEGQGIGT